MEVQTVLTGDKFNEKVAYAGPGSTKSPDRRRRTKAKFLATQPWPLTKALQTIQMIYSAKATADALAGTAHMSLRQFVKEWLSQT